MFLSTLLQRKGSSHHLSPGDLIYPLQLLSIWRYTTFCDLVLSKAFPKQAQWFLRFCNINLLKRLGKAEIARYAQFLLFPQCFLPVSRIFCHFRHILNCHLQTLSVWNSLKFVIWERYSLFEGEAGSWDNLFRDWWVHQETLHLQKIFADEQLKNGQRSPIMLSSFYYVHVQA